MTNNEILRRIRYLFNFSDEKMLALFKLVNVKISLSQLESWLRKEDDPELVEMTDKELAAFLNGLIIEKRGKREGPLPEAEDRLSNNMILKKMKIALDLQTDEIIDLYASVEKKLSKHELSAFLRNPKHKSYRPCLDQYLRNFFNALQKKNK